MFSPISLLKIMAIWLFILTACKKDSPPEIFKTSPLEGDYTGSKKGKFVWWFATEIDTIVTIRIDAVNDSMVSIREGNAVLTNGIVIDQFGQFGKSGSICHSDTPNVTFKYFHGKITGSQLTMEECFDSGSTPGYGWNYLWKCSK